MSVGRRKLTVADALRLHGALLDGDVEALIARLQANELDEYLDRNPLDLLPVEWDALLGVLVPNGEGWRDQADRLRDVLIAEGKNTSRRKAGRRVVLTPASQFSPKAVEWLWDGRIPAGGVSLLAGKGGLGKSTLILGVAALLSRGDLDGRHQGEPAAVLYATREDAWPQVVVPRLMGARADLDRVMDIAIDNSQAGFVENMSVPEDLNLLADGVEESEARLLVIDPLVAFLSDKVDSHRDHQIRRALGPLHRLAEQHDLAVVGVVHLNKRESRSAADRINGSVGFYNAARSVLLLTEAGDDDIRLLTHPKSNLAKPAVTLRYRIEGAEVRADDRLIKTSRAVLVGEAPEVGPGEGLATLAEAEDRSALGEACRFLEAELVEGPVLSTDLDASAKREGISSRTLRRAKDDLRVRSKKDGPNATWRCHPYTKDGHGSQEQQLGHLGHLDGPSRQGVQDVQDAVLDQKEQLFDLKRASGDRSQNTSRTLNPADLELGLVTYAFGEVRLLDGTEAELHLQDLEARQWNYLVDHLPGSRGSDLCRCGRQPSRVTPDEFFYCDACGPPGSPRRSSDSDERSEILALSLWEAQD